MARQLGGNYRLFKNWLSVREFGETEMEHFYYR